jgi:vesicle-fusing ATPase
MDLRNNLFGKGPGGGGGGLPSRPTQRPGGDGGMNQGGYDSYGQRSPARPQGRGGGAYGGEPRYQQPPPRGGQPVRLRLAKIEDKTLQSQYIFTNMYVWSWICDDEALTDEPF